MNLPDWPAIIMHVDMDAFFAQVEQRDFSQLRGQPVCLTNGEEGSCIITCSYEARAFGIKTGMRIRQARQLCPQLIRRSARPHVYAAASTRIMQLLGQVSPDLQIFSVDEAFVDLSYCRNLYAGVAEVAALSQRLIKDDVGLTCSIGISGDKTTAKLASKRNKPNGVCIIPPSEAKKVLAPLAVTELCGINKGIAQFLAQHGVYYCYQMEQLPISVLAQRFGNMGRRIWKMCLGEDPDSVHDRNAPPKSMGHGKVMPPNTRDKKIILSYLCYMCEKVAARLRAYKGVAQKYYIGIKLNEGWLVNHYRTIEPTDDGLIIYRLAQLFLQEKWRGEGVWQCQVTALDPQLGSGQVDLFLDHDAKQDGVNQVMDAINHKFGARSMLRTPCLHPFTADVISPSWRPPK